MKYSSFSWFYLFLLVQFVLFVSCVTGTIKLERLVSNIPCTSNSDCNQPSSECSPELKCKCYDGYLLEKNRTHYECFKAPENIFDECKIDEQCEYSFGTKSYCEMSENRCECKDDAHFDEDAKKCFQSVGIGDKCNHSKECLLPDNSYAVCDRGICACDISQSLTPDGLCVTNILLGNPCTENEECSHIFAVCNGVCKCGVDRVVSNNGSVCLKAAAEFGSACAELAQCNTYLWDGICANGKCTCMQGFHNFSTTCYKSADINTACFEDRECYMDDRNSSMVHCNGGICVWKSNYNTGIHFHTVSSLTYLLVVCALIFNIFR